MRRPPVRFVADVRTGDAREKTGSDEAGNAVVIEWRFIVPFTGAVCTAKPRLVQWQSAMGAMGAGLMVEHDTPQRIDGGGPHRVAHVDDAVRRARIDRDVAVREPAEPLHVARLAAGGVEPREVAAHVEPRDTGAGAYGHRRTGSDPVNVETPIMFVHHFPDQQVGKARLRGKAMRLVAPIRRSVDGLPYMPRRSEGQPRQQSLAFADR